MRRGARVRVRAHSFAVPGNHFFVAAVEVTLTTLFSRAYRTQEYLTHSPDFADVLNIWDSYHANHAQKVCAPLLALCGTMMTRARETAATSGRTSGDGWTERERLALDSLARAIMSRRMRQIYSHLASGVRVRVNAGLMTLAGIAGRGKRCASELFRTFDFSLAVLPKIASPPRDSGAKDGTSQRRHRDGKDVLAGSTRRAFCEFVLAFFAVNDAALLRPVLAQRVLFGNVARFSASDDPSMQIRMLHVIKEDIISAKSGVPARLRAALFGDVTLEQLATMAGGEDVDDEASTSGRVARDAREVLCELFTNPAHGLCPERSGAAPKKCQSIVRLLQKLRPMDCEAHLTILLRACETHPALAMMYLPNAKYALEPRLSVHWLAATGLIGRVCVAAAADASASSADARADGAALVVGESEGLAYVKAVIPPGLTKQTLAKGIAHASPMIRHAALCLLLNVTKAVGARVAYLESAIREGDMKRRGRDHRSWRLDDLLAYARLGASTMLPDVQSIMAAYTASKGGKEKDAAAMVLMRCHALNAIAAFVTIVPDALMDAKIDLNKLLPTNDPTSLPHGELAAVINVLCAAKGLRAEGQSPVATVVAATTGHDTGVNQGHILSVLRVALFASSASARDSAKSLAKHYLVTSGALDRRADEADVWIDVLASAASLTDARDGKDVIMACTEFLAEATTVASRRRFKHDATVQTLLKKHAAERPERYAVTGEVEDEYLARAASSVSALAATSAENVVKVLKSAKRSREFKLAVCAYVSAVFMTLVPTSFDPWASALCASMSIHGTVAAAEKDSIDEIAAEYPAMSSLRHFLSQCLATPDTKRSTKKKAKPPPTRVNSSSPLEWTSTQIASALSDGVPDESNVGVLFFATRAHGSMTNVLRPGMAANVMFGVSAAQTDEGDRTRVMTTLIESMDCAGVIACIASGDAPVIGAALEESGPARELCARALASCPATYILRSIRALVFWCKWNHARGDTRAVSRLLELCAVALRRARLDDGVSMDDARAALFARTSLYSILDASTSGGVANLITLDVALSDGAVCELHEPYVNRAVESSMSLARASMTSSAANAHFVDGSVSLVSLATDAAKVSLLRACADARAYDAGVKVAAAVLNAPPPTTTRSDRARFDAIRLAIRAALDPDVSVLVVNEACRVAANALDALLSSDITLTFSGCAPDLAAAPEAIALIDCVATNSQSAARVRLAASFVAQSDALADYFVANPALEQMTLEDMIGLMPIVAHVFTWLTIYGADDRGVDLAKRYRAMITKDFTALLDAESPTFSEHAVDVLVLSVKLAPMDAEDGETFRAHALPREGWVTSAGKADASVLAQMATELYAESESIEEQLMLMTSVLASLAVLTPPGKSKAIARGAALEKILAETLSRVLDALDGRDMSDAQFNVSVVSNVVKATKAFIKQSAAHRFRAHRRWAIIRKISAALARAQSRQFEMKALAEFATACVVSHPLFARVLADLESDVDSQLPTNIKDTPSTVKSIVEVAVDASEPSAPSEPSSASALKLELLRVLHTFWRMQNANGENTSKSCNQWRAEQVRVIPTLAAGYGATLSEIDRTSLDLMLEIDASTGGGALRSMGYLWGESVNHFIKASLAMKKQNEGDAVFDVDDLLYCEPSSALIAASIREGTPPDARRAAATAARFPVSRGIPLTQDTSTEDEHATCADELVAFGYDPAWVLPFTLHALKAGAMDVRESIAWGLAPLACAALSSTNDNIRQVAYGILLTLEQQLDDPLMSFRERTQVLSCLSSLRNATATPMIRWPSPSAVLAAECLMSCLYPETDTFLPLHRQLNKRAALDLDGVPMFLPMLNSGDIEARQYRMWILRLLRASLKDDIDTTMFRKTFALEVIMSHYSTTLAEPFVRFMMLDVVSRACSVVHSARLLVEGGGLIAWLASVATSACLNDKHGIRAGETTAIRVATARMATSALVTLIRHKGSIYLGPTGTAADYLSALHAIRAVLLRRDEASASNAEIAARRAALGPYLQLHIELSARLRRRIAEVGDPVEIANLCRAVDAAPDADALRDDMFTVVVTSEGGGQYAKRYVHDETSRALADAVVFCAAWAAGRARDVASRHRCHGEGAFEKVAHWCAFALASGGPAFADALVHAPECGGAARFAAIAVACARAASPRARRALNLPLIAAQLCLLRTIERTDDDTDLSEADRAIKTALRSPECDAIDDVVGAAAMGEPTAARLARASLRAVFAGVDQTVFNALRRRDVAIQGAHAERSGKKSKRAREDNSSSRSKKQA